MDRNRNCNGMAKKIPLQVKVLWVLLLSLLTGMSYAAKSISSESSSGLPAYPIRLVLFETFMRST